MTALNSYHDLTDQGFNFWLEKGALKYRAPKGKMTADILAWLKTHKTELISLLETNEHSEKIVADEVSTTGKNIAHTPIEERPPTWSMDRYAHLITCQQCEHLTLTGYCRVKSLTKPMPDAMRECTKFNQLTNERTKISNVPYTQSELDNLITHCKSLLLSHLAQCPSCKISHPHFCTDASAINSDYEAMLLCFENADTRQDYLITPY